MATRLGDMAVGSTVKIEVDGAVKDFIIVHQGNPNPTIYDSSCNGTWVLMKNIYENRAWDSTSNNNYGNSDIHSYLNSTFLNLFNPNIKNNIKPIEIPYGGTYGGLSTKIFLLSSAEINFNLSSGYYPNGEGSPLAYFQNCNANGSDEKRVAYFNGSTAAWLLRTRYTANSRAVYYVTYNGDVSNDWYYRSAGVRPAFILPSTLLAYGDDLVVGNEPPEVTSDAGVSGAELGEKNTPFTVGYTVTDKDGDLMTVTEKLDGAVKQTRAEVATGTTLTVDWLAEKAGYQQVLNGAHTMTLTVSDGKTSTDWTATFTKNVTGAKVSLTAPLTADDTITVAALTLEGSFPADMSLTVELTNNALDDSPVWETVTDIQSGEAKAFVYHSFTNTTAAKGFAFDYKITVARGESGTGGTLTMIGGVIG